MESFFVFSDEAGNYSVNPTRKFIYNHPFYVRSNILISVEDYAKYQDDVKEMNNKYEIPVFEEIKWSDLWLKRRGKPRNEFIADIDVNTLREYFDSIFKMTENIDSLKIILSVTKNTEENYIHRDTMVRFHLQEAFQRVNRDLKRNGFAVFIIDELPDDYSKRTKEMSHLLVEQGDIVKYTSLYSGVLFENSNLSAGIQLADYTAGVFNSFLKSIDLNIPRAEPTLTAVGPR